MNMTYMTNPVDDGQRVVVIGGGAAGMMAAIRSAELGANTLIIERNERCGRKLRITGKGRCNITNDCSPEEFLTNVPTNPKFLYSALGRFDTSDTKSFFEELGVPVKVERGKRVFPVSDKATDVVDAMVKKCKSLGVSIICGRVSEICSENGKVTAVKLGDKVISASAVIIATGGRSYPLTGSDGDGYKLAEKLGHTTVPTKPSLVPLTSSDKDCPAMQGLSLKNVGLTVVDSRNGKSVFKDFGEMMFTHFGLTGPMVLSASAHIKDVESGAYLAKIDLKPALDEKTLDSRILSDFKKQQNKDFTNALDSLLPQKMIPVIIRRSGIDSRKKVNSITKEERSALLSAIKEFTVPLKGFRPIEEAIITKGGISTKEISPGTMESKLCAGLFFAGEVIDVDAYTGGFNLQIAFSTGILAGENAAYLVL